LPAGSAAAAAVGSAVAGPGGAAIAAGAAAQGRKTLDQGLFSRKYIADVTDDLVRSGGIQVTVLDRSQALDIDAGDMDGLLSLIVDKLVEVMFDSTTGWAKEPPREQAVAYESIQGKTTEGWLAKAFGGRNRQYAADDLYVRKDRDDIRTNRFSIILSRSTTIKVPVDASGNLGGLYQSLGADPRYFRVVSLDDPAFQFRDVHFQIDGDFVDSFSDLVNFASVTVRKSYAHNPEMKRDLLFSLDELKEGRTIQAISFPRLGESDEHWHDYEYRTEWSLRGGPTLVQPKDGGWMRGTSAAVSLRPPLEKQVLQLDVDRASFEAHGVRSAVIRFATVVGGETRKQREAHVRADDLDTTSTVVIYHDPGQAVAYQVDWYFDAGKVSDGLALLESDYLRLTAPAGAGGAQSP
jgi:hypothetical protein